MFGENIAMKKIHFPLKTLHKTCEKLEAGLFPHLFSTPFLMRL